MMPRSALTLAATLFTALYASPTSVEAQETFRVRFKNQYRREVIIKLVGATRQYTTEPLAQGQSETAQGPSAIVAGERVIIAFDEFNKKILDYKQVTIDGPKYFVVGEDGKITESFYGGG
jgi:hypothetical protein